MIAETRVRLGGLVTAIVQWTLQLNVGTVTTVVDGLIRPELPANSLLTVSDWPRIVKVLSVMAPFGDFMMAPSTREVIVPVSWASELERGKSTGIYIISTVTKTMWHPYTRANHCSYNHCLVKKQPPKNLNAILTLRKCNWRTKMNKTRSKDGLNKY